MTEKTMKDYIRLGLAIKARWPEIKFETVEIYEVPFGCYQFELPVLENKAVWTNNFDFTCAQRLNDYPDCPQFKKEVVDVHRFRSKQVEFTAGYTPVSNKLLVGVKE